MFTCLWNLWDWLDPSMENKKTAQTNEPLNNNAVPKHSHQHNAPQGRLLQYPLLSQPHQHQPQNVQQKFLNNQLHQYVPYNPSQPSNRPLYNPLNQHNPQIWVPHQPPVHYHNQQLKNETNQPRQTPVHQKPKEPERKKSNQQLRSPIAKRPPQAPVTMQGWLHKQGSEGLMLWKKRWFVLSEYCLFYYKGSEEEKLLGSILLPSYKVSVCGPQDKINKKFAFKCEHSNMRTYILAADSHESMVKWVQLLNSACLLQSQCDVMPQPAQAEPAVPVHQYHQMPLNRIIPIHTHSSSNTTDLSSPSQQELMQYTQQPLYANAPPKPRRINSSYSSPSPEVSERYMRDIRALQYVPQHPDVYSRKHPQIPKYHIREPPVYLSHNSERRTPDTYGRSKLATKVHYPGDYEDVYAEQAYKRPVSPLAYSNNTRRLSPMVSAMQPARVPSMTGPVSVNRPAAIITRPHSADFLEYEVSRVADVRPQQPRPKSSLDINRNTQNNDSYFYSEQRYAENMRKSAQYLPHMPKFAAGAQNGRVTMPNTPPIKLENLSITEPNRSRSVLSEGSLSKELEADMRGYYDVNNSVTMTPQRQFEMRRPEYDQFMRSASARLAYSDRGSEVKSISREGERKREESMKRLLEWKQRMLQSPLNRKVSQSVTSRGNQDYFDRIHVNPEQKSGISLSQYNSYSSDDEASGSMSLNLREAYPRNWGPNPQHLQSRSNSHEFHDKSLRKPLGHYSQHELDANKRANNQWTSGMNVSAGELLGRTHEELVLLLIQLRRQSTNTCHAIEACYNEIDSIQAQMHLMGQAKRMESLQKLEQIKQHLVELEKQYEKGKPLVNLVDNMVKLGSLYRSPTDRYNPYIRDKLEFNQNIQERRLLTEEKRDWNRLNSNHSQLQEKVHELYQLDRLIQEESGTLHSLQQDKEDIERALGDLRHRINQGLNDPAEIEQAMKQQMALENELSRVHSMLAENSKKLEETVAGNARLEQKLLVLKQKLQISRQQRNSPQFSNPGDSLPCFVGTSAMLESDLQKVQQKVGDLQRQRHELSTQVRHLTDRSSNLQQDVKLSNTLGSKRKVQSVWRETDLDTMNIVDHGETSVNSPLYINTDLKQSSESDVYNYGMKSSDSTSDDTTQNSSNLCHVEKQEIKTVRIVKRESERRHRDREKSAPGKWELVPEEDDSSQFCTASVYSDSRLTSSTDESKSSELSPVFKSEAARQIITEMSVQETPKLVNRRLVPKEKRRHYTAPHNNLIMKSLNQLPTADNSTILLNEKRARDDLDMERALRQRIDAPDVVRSTLSNKELKYNENTIDTILGTPNKISIPERYIPEQLPQLSAEEQEHRLRKVESIKKMLSDTIIASGNPPGFDDKEKAPNLLSNKATSKMIEEKKQREHLLQLNQILAKQVMEMSKIVAVKALAALPLQEQQVSTEDEDLSPVTPLPLYQQRDNFYS